MFGDVVEKKAVPVAVVKEILEKVKEPKHEQKLVFEYVSKFSRVSAEDARKLLSELMEAGIPRLREEQAVKLVDLMPATPDEIKTIFAKEDVTLSKEDIQKILDILARYR